MSSRVPLLVKSKGRKPSRLPIAPRVKPSNARVNRAPHGSGPVAAPTPQARKPVPTTAPAQSTVATSTTATDAPKASPSIATAAETEASAPPVAKITVAKQSVTTITVQSAAPAAAAHVSAPRKAGGISIGSSLTASSSSSPATNPKLNNSKPATRSPVILPVQRRPERLAKISSAGPVYRPSPVLGPRAGNNSNGAATDNPMKQRLTRRLDIKPHQSPRRAAAAVMQQQSQRQQNDSTTPSSPFLLGGKAPEVLEKEAAEGQADVLQARRATRATPARRKTPPARKTRATPAKKQKVDEDTASSESSKGASPARRRSLGRKAKRSQSYREVDASEDSMSEPDDDRDEDVNPNELDLPEGQPTIYMPARERATMWAKSVLRQHEEGDDAEDTSRSLVTRERKTGGASAARRKRSNSTASSISSLVSGIGAGSGNGTTARARMEELLKKEPSQMTMGELALTVPKGRRMKRHEREEAASSADTPLLMTSSSNGDAGSSLLNSRALNRVRSLSVSSESAAFAGSLVTPQVQIVDGQMVVMESTIKLGDQLQQSSDLVSAGGGDDDLGIPPRHSGTRLNSSHPNGPGKRWGKEETKQFYYVGPNFSMMATLFPSRKRKELKSKFKYEEKNHAKLIEIALRASTAPLDTEMVSVISQMVDKDAQKKLDAKQRKRKAKSPLALTASGDDGFSMTTSVASPALSSASAVTAASPLPAALASTPLSQSEEFLETVDEEDLYLPERRGSFDFSG